MPGTISKNYNCINANTTLQHVVCSVRCSIGEDIPWGVVSGSGVGVGRGRYQRGWGWGNILKAVAMEWDGDNNQ